MDALRLIDAWPVDAAGAAVVTADGVHGHGAIDHVLRLASVSKLLTAWATLIAIEEGSVDLDDPVGQPGCTVHHLLAHAGGYGFDGEHPVTRPGRNRIYSNTGIELLAAHVAGATGVPFDAYVREAVCEPLGMPSTTPQGSPAKSFRGTVRDLAVFAGELMHPTLIAPETAAMATSVQFPELGGVLPGVGRFHPLPWGLGPEIRGTKSPHWTGTTNSPSTFGHFGGSGTFLWVDPVAGAACVMLANREFDEWGLAYWPAFSDAVLAELSA